MDTNAFRRIGHELIDWVADYRERIETLPVMSRAKPGDVRAKIPKEPPQKGVGLEGLGQTLNEVVMPGITHWTHPGFFGYFPSNTDLASVLGDLVASGLGVQGMSWVTSPAATEVEETVMSWLRQMLGLSESFSGVIHDTASTATFCALLCARERTTGFSQNRGGMQAEVSPLTVYASDQAHSSVPKGALLAGFGREYLHLIETDKDHAMRIDLLEAAIQADLDAGRRPCALVAAIGTTATTGLDPLVKMAELAKRHGLWLHVDAAMAGTAMTCPEYRWMWEGIEHADSIVTNPHKWMGVGFDLTAYFVKDPQHLIRVMGTDPSYLRTAFDAEVNNFRDWGIPLGRRFRSLKLWFLILDRGVEAIQELVRRNVSYAAWLAAQIDSAPNWQRMGPAHLQTVSLRHVPSGMATDEDALSAHNLVIADAINAAGRQFVTTAMVKGQRLIRASIGAQATEMRHVEGLWEALQKAAAETK
ncbi:MAG: aspartate aminotransferase family protein [Holophagales bacterium]|jgi:aromatic-L-amino-acid decarboxylase|nr:aspartate aminotransferase family protein [Holophagales bacterium]